MSEPQPKPQATGAPFEQLRRRLINRLGSGELSESAIVMVTAIAVGAVTGLAALLFRALLDFVGFLAFDVLAGRLGGLTPATLILIPAGGGLLVGLITGRTYADARGSGIPEVMEAVALRGGRIRGRLAVVKAFAASICIGTGGSAGREGPIAQIGSALGSTIGRFLRLPEAQVKNLVACGAAGGIAATFNAPIAGSLFALEVILGHFHATYFGAVVISAVVADVVFNYVEGSARAFLVPEYTLVNPIELAFYAVLGLAAGLLAHGFGRLLDLSETAWARLPLPNAIRAGLGGALLGTIGVLTFKADGWPHIFGVGYDTIDAVLLGQLSLGVVIGLLFLKMVATAVTLGSGGSGGVFAPSLYVGAMTGGAFGQIVNAIAPGVTAPSGAYALVGMAAFVSGAVQTPVTVIVMLFELTGNYTIILPLMIATVMSAVASRLSGHDSFYTAKLRRRGIHLQRGKDIDVMQGVTVREAMSPVTHTVPLDMPLSNLAQRFADTHAHAFPVVDAGGLLAGTVSIGDFDRALADGPIADRTVGDIATREFLVVTTPDEPMSRALRRLATRDISRLPVVAAPGSRELVGIVRRADIIRAYNHALVKRAHHQHRIEQLSLEKLDDAMFGEIDVPADAWATGRTVAEIPLPEACLIVGIRRGRKLHIAHGHSTLQAGDIVTVLAEQSCLPAVRRRLTARAPDGASADDPSADASVRQREVLIPDGARVAGATLASLHLPAACLVVSVERDGRLLIPHGDTRLRPNDAVTLLGTPAVLEAVADRLKAVR